MSSEEITNLLAEIARRQITFVVDPARPDRIRYWPKSAMTGELAEKIRRFKPVLLKLLQPSELPADISNLPPAWREEFDERAAILEYDGELSRNNAERQALREIGERIKQINELKNR